MVVSNRDIGNTFSSTLAISYTIMQMTSLPANVAIDIDDIAVDNYDNIRERTLFSSKVNLRSTSMSSSVSSEAYYNKIEYLNDLPDEEFREHVDSSQLSYNDHNEEESWVSMIANYNDKMRQQCTVEKISVLKSAPTQYIDNNINIQLPYDPNKLIEPEL